MYADKFNVDVLLFWEHRDREIEVIVEIAKRLKHDHGLAVAIASTVYDRFFSLFLVRPKVVVFHSNKSLPPLFHALYREKITYVCLNWEQMLSTFNKTAAKKPDDFLNKHLMKNFVWGKDFYNFLKEIGVPSKNVFITGRPSLSLLQKKALQKAEIKSKLADQYRLDKNIRWLFFPLTCLHAFFDDKLVRHFVRNTLISNQVDIDLAFARRDYVRSTIKTIFAWIDSLCSAESNNFQIILRPHPLISVEQHSELFKKISGKIPSQVILTKELTAQEWLIASDACYTNYSSLALDTYFLKKPAFLMEPEPYPDFLSYEWFNAFKKLESYTALENTLRELDTWTFKKDDLIEKQFDTELDGIEETASLLSKFAGEIQRYPSLNPCRVIKQIKDDPKATLNLRSLKLYLSYKTNYKRHRIPIGRQSDFLENSELKRMLA